MENNHKHPDFKKEFENFMIEQENRRRKALRDLKESHSKIVEANLLVSADQKNDSWGPLEVEQKVILTVSFLLSSAEKLVFEEIQRLENIVEKEKDQGGPAIGHP